MLIEIAYMLLKWLIWFLIDFLFKAPLLSKAIHTDKYLFLLPF